PENHEDTTMRFPNFTALRFPAPAQVNAAAPKITRFHLLALLCVFTLIAGVAPHDTWASSSSTDELGLGELLDWLVGLIQGPLGKILAISAFVIGAIAGVVRGSLMFFAIGM